MLNRITYNRVKRFKNRRETQKNNTYMTHQRKTRIKTLFKKSYAELVEKLKSMTNCEKVRVITILVKLGKYDCVICYDFKKESFTKIKVIEETIEL